jgi:hypothetical protein
MNNDCFPRLRVPSLRIYDGHSFDRCLKAVGATWADLNNQSGALRRLGTDGSQTPRRREMDSNL